MSEPFFSSSYSEARTRFLDAARQAGARLQQYPINAECQDELFIDVAILGDETAPALLTTSGIHGVEGFFGSAVQLALLSQIATNSQCKSIRYVFVHGINPFGFSNLRRFNEDNVDLNRNFLSASENYEGAPVGYAALNGFLNPGSAPSRFEPFKLKAIWNIWKHGLPSLKQSIAAGQYEFPRGLFFGGSRPCQSNRTVAQNCESWLGHSQKVIHIDLHTGLGPFGTYKLLLAESKDSPDFPWYAQTFGAESIEPSDVTDGTAYSVTGQFGAWMQKKFESRSYWFVTAEFGTYDVIRVLAALRAENRMHHFGSKDSRNYVSTKAELFECFCPSDESWRQQVIESSRKIIEQAERAFHSNW